MRRQSFAVHVALLVVCACLLTTMLQAQYRASIQGVVTDPTGAVVPGATVTLKDKETNRSLTAVTDDGGIYNFGGLPPSRYLMTVERNGFKKKVLEDFGIIPEQSNAVNVQLELGQATETVTVSGNATAPIDTETAQVSGTISAQQIQSLPSYGRDPFKLLNLAPGVFGENSLSNGGGAGRLPGSEQAAGGATDGVFKTENQVQVSANGMRTNNNAYQIDGVQVNSQAWNGSAVITPNEESVKEVKVLVNNYSAELGRQSGAQVLVVSKNGTNDYHGSLFFKADRPGLNAYEQWRWLPGSPAFRANNRFNQFGGSVGGPIVKNRLFAFFSYETLRNNSVGNALQWFETPQFLASAAPSGSVAEKFTTYKGMGPKFSRILPVTCTDINLVENTNCATITTGGAYAGLDVGRPLTSALGTQDPSWNGNNTPGLGGDGSGDPANLDGVPDIMQVFTVTPSTNTSTQYNGRLDLQLTSKDLIAFSTYWVPTESHFYNGAARASNFWNHNGTNLSGALLWTHTFSSNMINEARINASGWHWNEVKSNPQAPFGLPQDLLDSIGAAGVSQFGPNGPSIFNQISYNFRDTLTKVVHSHTLKFGADLYNERASDQDTWDARPAYFFHNLWDFANDAPYIEGFPWGGTNFNPTTGVPTTVSKRIRSNIYAFFVQDDYKVRPNLTVNIGLRWEYFAPISDVSHNLANAFLGTGGANPLVNMGVRVGGQLYDASKNNWGPQLGFAWSPSKFNSHLVLRGGFGIGYDRIEQGPTLNVRSNYPLVANESFTGSNILYAAASNLQGLGPYPANPAAIAPPGPNGLPVAGSAPINLVGVNLHMATPRTYRYSTDIQYELHSNWVATIGYQGSKSTNYTRSISNLNFIYAPGPLNPLVRQFTYWTDDASSNYNALLTELKHSFSRSFELDTQYRFSKAIDEATNSFYGDQYPYNVKFARGPADYDATHNFKIWGIWSPTIFRGEYGWLEKVAGGWSISGILNAHSGFPWTAKYAGATTSCNLIYSGSGYCDLRPAAYLGGAGSDYSNSSFERANGNFPNGGPSYFTVPQFVDGSSTNFPNATAAPAPPGVGRNSFRGPRYFGVDMTLSKAFGFPKMPVLGEGAKLEFRANFYNIFNKLNLDPGQIDNTITDGHFGRVNAALGGRVVELQARFNF